jgi:hypothetical protein
LIQDRIKILLALKIEKKKLKIRLKSSTGNQSSAFTGLVLKNSISIKMSTIKKTKDVAFLYLSKILAIKNNNFVSMKPFKTPRKSGEKFITISLLPFNLQIIQKTTSNALH